MFAACRVFLSSRPWKGTQMWKNMQKLCNEAGLELVKGDENGREDRLLLNFQDCEVCSSGKCDIRCGTYICDRADCFMQHMCWYVAQVV